jgi:uncharacterized membrane protein
MGKEEPMGGFVVGVVVTLMALLGAGLVGRLMWRARRGCGGHRRSWSFDGPRSEGRARAWGEVFKRKLGIDEDQEDVVDHAWTDGRAAVRDFVQAMKETRGPLAASLRSETLDEGSIAVLFRQQDEAIARVRRELLSAIKQVHAVLSPAQRERLASWLGAGRVGWV